MRNRSKKRTAYWHPKADDKDKTSKLNTPTMLAMRLNNGEKFTPVNTEGMLENICNNEMIILPWPNILLTFFIRFVR